MTIAMEEVGELTRVAKVTIPGVDFEKGVDRELRKLSTKVKLRGFRKGKIPMRVLRQNYGESVKRDVMDSLIRKHLGEVVDQEERLLFVAQPEVTAIPIGGQGDLEFKVEIELRPELDPIGYLGIDVERPKVEVDAAVVDAELESLREKFGSIEPIEGRDAIVEFWGGFFGAMDAFELTLTNSQAERNGTLGWSRGDYTLSFTPQGGAEISDAGKYALVWRRGPNGKWQIALDVYNTNLPPAGQ